MKVERLRRAAFRLWLILSAGILLWWIGETYKIWDDRPLRWFSFQLAMTAIAIAGVWLATVGLAWFVSAFIEDDRPKFFEDDPN